MTLCGLTTACARRTKSEIPTIIVTTKVSFPLVRGKVMSPKPDDYETFRLLGQMFW
jgi:hypothetical protein